MTAADSEPATPEPLTPAEPGLTPQGLDLEQQGPLVISQGDLIPQTVLPPPHLRKRPSWAIILATV